MKYLILILLICRLYSANAQDLSNSEVLLPVGVYLSEDRTALNQFCQKIPYNYFEEIRQFEKIQRDLSNTSLIDSVELREKLKVSIEHLRIFADPIMTDPQLNLTVIWSKSHESFLFDDDYEDLARSIRSDGFAGHSARDKKKFLDGPLEKLNSIEILDFHYVGKTQSELASNLKTSLHHSLTFDHSRKTAGLRLEIKISRLEYCQMINDLRINVVIHYTTKVFTTYELPLKKHLLLIIKD